MYPTHMRAKGPRAAISRAPERAVLAVSVSWKRTISHTMAKGMNEDVIMLIIVW